MTLLEQKLKELKNKHQTKINKEGAEAFVDDVVRSIVLQGISLNLNTDTFYYSKEEKFKNFLEELERLRTSNKEWFDYLVGITLYLKENQRKLSPTIILSYLVSKSDELSWEQKDKIKKLMDVILDNPKRIYEFIIVTMLLKNWANLRVLPPYVRRKIKDILETYDYYTLLNNRLLRKPVKLRDMLKFFHPNPTANTNNPKFYEKLFKDIIENRASLTKYGIKNIVTEKSEKRGEVSTEALERAGINQLIRNLINTEYSEEQLEVIKKRLTDVLIDLEKGKYNVLKILNVYDLFSIVLSPKFTDKKYKEVVDLLERILYYWIKYSKYANITREGEDLVVVQDLSGSMDYGESLLRSAILLTLVLIKNPQVEIIVFDTKYNDETEYFKNFLRYREKPLIMTYELHRGLEKLGSEKYFGGTALRDAVNWTIKKFNPEKMIIISDEVSWADEELLELFPEEIKKVRQVIFYNPERNDNDVQVVENIIRIAGLSTQVFSTLYDLNRLKKIIREKVKKLEELSKQERERRIKRKMNHF